MSLYTAVINSKTPSPQRYDGLEVVNHVQTVNSAAEMYDARLAALARVQTPFAFYMDDGDELPDDYLDMLDACADADCALAYTDEVESRGGRSRRRTSEPWDPLRFLARPMMAHHLMLMRTADVDAIRAELPQGGFLAEPLLAFLLAERSARYVPRVGYIWNRHADGLSSLPETLIAQVASAAWCARRVTWH